MKKTLGQIRVKADFNPEKSELIDQIKNKAAEFIDLCESYRLREGPISGEKHRVIALAQTNAETACMYAVKANFID